MIDPRTFAALTARLLTPGEGSSTPLLSPPAVSPPHSGTSPETLASTPKPPKPETPEIPPVTGILGASTPDQVRQKIREILGFDPSTAADMNAAIQAAQQQFGPFTEPMPRREDYQVSQNPWALALGAMFAGPYLGSFMQGYTTTQQEVLRSQQNYETALRNWQAGKAGWTKEIVQAARDDVNAKRGSIAAVAPYILERVDAQQRIAADIYRAGLQYLEREQQVDLGYLREWDLNQYRKAETDYRSASLRQHQAYNDAMIAIRQGQLDIAQQRIRQLSQEGVLKLQIEAANLKILQSKVQTLPYDQINRSLQGIASRIMSQTLEVDQLQNEVNKASTITVTDPLTHESKVIQNPAAILLDTAHQQLNYLLAQETALNTRLKELQSQPLQSQPPLPSPSPAPRPLGFTNSQIMQAIQNMVHSGLSRDQIKQRLQESNINPADWGY